MSQCKLGASSVLAQISIHTRNGEDPKLGGPTPNTNILNRIRETMGMNDTNLIQKGLRKIPTKQILVPTTI